MCGHSLILVTLALILGFALGAKEEAGGSPRGLSQAEALAHTVRTIQYEANVPIHIQLAKRMTASNRQSVLNSDLKLNHGRPNFQHEPMRKVAGVFAHPELERQYLRIKAAKELVADVNFNPKITERRPHPNQPTHFDLHMTRLFNTLDMALAGAMNEVEVAEDSVERINATLLPFFGNHLYGSERFPIAHSMPQLDGRLTTLSNMINDRFDQLDAKLVSLQAKAKQLEEIVPISETAIIRVPSEGSVKSVALLDDMMAVGVHYENWGYDDYSGEYWTEFCAHVFVYQLQQTSWNLINTLVDGQACRNSTDLGAFGASLALEGDFILVGVPDADGNGPRSGKVNVYRCNHGANCVLAQTLVPTLEIKPVGTLEEVTEAPTEEVAEEYTGEPDMTEEPWWQFSATNRDTSSSNPEPSEMPTEEPTEYVLPEDKSQWTEDDWYYYCDWLGGWWMDEQTCNCHYYGPWYWGCPIVDNGYSSFGKSLALQNGALIIGAIRERKEANSGRNGAVYFYRMDPETSQFLYEAKDFAVFDPNHCSWCYDDEMAYGVDVALHGNHAAVASYRLPYIMLYEHDGQMWNRKDRFYPGGEFAMRVRLSENRLLAASESLAALYEWNGVDWTKRILYHQYYYCWPYVDNSWPCGMHVAMEGDKIAVVDPYYPHLNGWEQGAVIVFRYDVSSQSWLRQPAVLMGQGVEVNRDVSMSGEHLMMPNGYGNTVHYFRLS